MQRDHGVMKRRILNTTTPEKSLRDRRADDEDTKCFKVFLELLLDRFTEVVLASENVV
jgi:hypothetical protein